MLRAAWFDGEKRKRNPRQKTVSLKFQAAIAADLSSAKNLEELSNDALAREEEERARRNDKRILERSFSCSCGKECCC